MKRFFIGLCCGCFFSFTTAAFASDSVKAILSPVTFVFNGSEKALADDYAALNYNGHVEQNNAVTVDYATAAGFPLKDPYADFVRFGNVKVTSAGSQSKVTGQIKMTDAFDDDLYFSLTFYDDQGNRIGSVSPGSSIHLNAGEIRSFELAGDGDFSNYAVVSFRAISVKGGPGNGFPPGHLAIADSEHPEVHLGELRIDTIGGFSRIVGHIEVDGPLSDVDATLKFYTSSGEVLGEAHLKCKAGGGGITSFEAIGKGDFSAYKEVKMFVQPLQNSNNAMLAQ